MGIYGRTECYSELFARFLKGHQTAHSMAYDIMNGGVNEGSSPSEEVKWMERKMSQQHLSPKYDDIQRKVQLCRIAMMKSIVRSELFLSSCRVVEFLTFLHVVFSMKVIVG